MSFSRPPATRGASPSRYKLPAALLLALAVCALTASAARAATISVPAGGNFQAALDAAQPGDTITLEAGASYVGPFTLPNKGGADWITVTTSAAASLPAAGERVTPAHAPLMPKLVSPGLNQPALLTAPGAHHFRFVGVEFKPVDARAALWNLVELGDGSRAQDTWEEIAHHLVIDRCYLHGDPNGTLVRGIALNSAHTEIVNSHISEVKTVGFDTQAICGWNGPGPYRIVNNYLEAAGENVMFGGADPQIAGMVPSDIEIRRNHFFKPLAWRGVWTVKNLFELKNARRVVIDGNLFENNWVSAQAGYAILFTVRNQDGRAPWSTVEDVQFTNNVVRHTGSAVNILGKDDLQPSQQVARVTIKNNLFEDVDWERWGGHGNLLMVTEARDVVFEHNTAVHTGNVTFAYGQPTTGFVFRNNVVPHNNYGVFGNGLAYGNATLAHYFPGASFERNLVAGAPDWVYPAGNFYPASLDAAGFVNRAGGNYRLASSSPYRNAGTDGKDLGCDFDALEAAQAGRPPATPTPTPTATPTPTPTPTLQSLPLVAAAHTAATAMAAEAENAVAEFDALAAEIERAYAVFLTEQHLVAERDQVEKALRSAHLFARGSKALSLARRYPVGVQNRLQIAAARLGQVLNLLTAARGQTLGGELAHAPSTNAPPIIGQAATASAATGAVTVSPASLVSVSAGDAAQSPLAGASASATRFEPEALAFELAGASVSIGGVAAPLLHASPGRVVCAVPPGLPEGEAEVIITSQDGYVSRGTVTIAAVAPGLLTREGGEAVAYSADGAAGADGRLESHTAQNLSADKRTRALLFATGVSSSPALNADQSNDVRMRNGEVRPNFAEAVAVEARTQDGRSFLLAVEYAGAGRMPGLDQITVVLPPELHGAGRVELTLVVAGRRSNTAAVNVR